MLTVTFPILYNTSCAFAEKQRKGAWIDNRGRQRPLWWAGLVPLSTKQEV